MTKGSIFGESFLTEKVSTNSLGDIRSGIRQLQVMQFKYEDMKKILTFPEQAAIKALPVDIDVNKQLIALAESNHLDRKEVF
jgi:hypothetical protein